MSLVHSMDRWLDGNVHLSPSGYFTTILIGTIEVNPAVFTPLVQFHLA